MDNSQNDSMFVNLITTLWTLYSFRNFREETDKMMVPFFGLDRL